jgi:hypothetical protein
MSKEALRQAQNIQNRIQLIFKSKKENCDELWLKIEPTLSEKELEERLRDELQTLFLK